MSRPLFVDSYLQVTWNDTELCLFCGNGFSQVLCRWPTMRLALLVQERAYLFALITADVIKVALLF